MGKDDLMMEGYALALVASVLWGLTYCLDEKILATLSVLHLYFLHCFVGVVVVGAILLAQGFSMVELVQVGNTSKWLLGLTLVTSTVAALAIMTSIKMLGASTSAILEISYPLFVALFSVLLFKGQLTGAMIVGGALIFCGAVVLVTRSS